MNRTDAFQAFDIDGTGRILTPGRFRGQMAYLPHFYWLYMHRLGDFTRDGLTITMTVIAEDRREFPELGDKQAVVFRIDRDSIFEIATSQADPKQITSDVRPTL